MSRSVHAFLALSLLSSLAKASTPRRPLSKAETVIAAAKLATGGAAWDKPEGCFETGTHDDGAMSYRTRFSLLDNGLRIDSERGSDSRSIGYNADSRSMGFNGKARWQAVGAGKADVRSDPASLEEGIVTNI